MHQAEGPDNVQQLQGIHTLHGSSQRRIRCILHHLMNEILFICCHSIHKFTTPVCCHIVYHCMQKHKTKLLYSAVC